MGSFCSCRTELDQVLESILVLVGVGARLGRLHLNSDPLGQGFQFGDLSVQETVDASFSSRLRPSKTKPIARVRSATVRRQSFWDRRWLKIENLWLVWFVILCGLPTVQQAAIGDCLSFDPFPFDQNGLAPPPPQERRSYLRITLGGGPSHNHNQFKGSDLFPSGPCGGSKSSRPSHKTSVRSGHIGYGLFRRHR